MPRKFYKFRLLLDENMPPRRRFPRLNGRYDVKHIRDDLHKAGISDEEVYAVARKQNRLVVTFNGDDFYSLASKSDESGVISVSENLRNEQIDTKLTALLMRSTQNSIYGLFTSLTGESEK